jgi:hypothetical protein
MDRQHSNRWAPFYCICRLHGTWPCFISSAVSVKYIAVVHQAADTGTVQGSWLAKSVVQRGRWWLLLGDKHSATWFMLCGNWRISLLLEVIERLKPASYCVSCYSARGDAVGWGTALQAERSRVRFPMVSLGFFIDIIVSVALWPWGRLSL